MRTSTFATIIITVVLAFIIVMCSTGCTGQPMTPYEAVMVDRGFQQAATGFYGASDIYARQAQQFLNSGGGPGFPALAPVNPIGSVSNPVHIAP